MTEIGKLEGYENYCSHYLGTLKEQGKFDKVTDGYNEVETIRIRHPISLSENKPSIIIDRFAPKRIAAPPEVKTIAYNELRRLGFVIISKAPRRRWYSGQTSCYKIVKENSVEGRIYVNHLPVLHKIQYDSANKMVRLVGRGAGEFGAGDWVEVE